MSQKISTFKNLAKETAEKQDSPCLQQSPKKAVPSINKQPRVSHTIVNDNFPLLRRQRLSWLPILNSLCFLNTFVLNLVSLLLT